MRDNLKVWVHGAMLAMNYSDENTSFRPRTVVQDGYLYFYIVLNNDLFLNSFLSEYRLWIGHLAGQSRDRSYWLKKEFSLRKLLPVISTQSGHRKWLNNMLTLLGLPTPLYVCITCIICVLRLCHICQGHFTFHKHKMSFMHLLYITFNGV